MSQNLYGCDKIGRATTKGVLNFTLHDRNGLFVFPEVVGGKAAKIIIDNNIPIPLHSFLDQVAPDEATAPCDDYLHFR